MNKTISRKRASETIDALMTQLYHISLTGPASSSVDQVSFSTTIQELVQLRFKDDYIQALNALSMDGFTEYYNLFMELVTAMGLESAKDIAEWNVVNTTTLPDSIAQTKKTGEVVELLDGFNAFELSKVSYTDRMKSIERILGDWFGLGSKDQQILKIIASMDGNEQAAFLSRLTDGKDPLLPKLLKKVDGPEKLSMFLFLQTMFLLSGMNVEDGGSCPTVYHDPANYKHFSASLKEGKVQVTQFEQTMGNGDVRQTAEWELPPFASVSYTLRDKAYTVPAFFLTDQETLAASIGEETLTSIIWGAMQGEFNENPTGKQILADIGINFIPIVGQICDARDIAACLDKLINKKQVRDTMVWITLILTAIGCIPYAGDVVKGALKAIVKKSDDVAIILVKKIGGDDIAVAIRILVSKLDGAIPEIRKMIQGWAEEAAQKGSPNAAEFFTKMDEMINAAVKEIRDRIDEFGNKVLRAGDASKVIGKTPDEAFNNKWFKEHYEMATSSKGKPFIKRKAGASATAPELTIKDGKLQFKDVSVPKGKVPINGKVFADIEELIPDVYTKRTRDALENMSSEKKKEVVQYIQELYNKYGSGKTMQDHHWIKQEFINNADYPFLKSPPMDINLLDNKDNLSLIVGHAGNHKNDYDRLLETQLLDIRDAMIKKYGEDNYLIAGAQIINTRVKKVVEKMKNTVINNNMIMNNRKLIVLD